MSACPKCEGRGFIRTGALYGGALPCDCTHRTKPQPPTPRWIPTTESLPPAAPADLDVARGDKPPYCIVCLRDHAKLWTWLVGYRLHDGRWYTTGGVVPADAVTHWWPIPQGAPE